MTTEINPTSTSSGAPPTPDLKVLRSLLIRAGAFVPAPQPKTFFSIGRRGHWENAASDVLAFFLNPHGEHGFGQIFLRVFFDCLDPVGTGHLDLENSVSVDVEERLEGDKRIDLVASGTGWVLAIENKIDHWVANDLPAYAAHMDREAGPTRKVHLAVLAPRIEKHPGWIPVTYPNLCSKLTAAFDEQFPALPVSTCKWQVFAREFVTHLQTLRQPAQMKLDAQQLELVENHLPDIQTLKRLSADYTSFLQAELTERLGLVLPGWPPFVFVERDQDWALVCDGPRGSGWQLTFQTPGHSKGNRERKFIAYVDLGKAADEEHRQRAQRELAGMSTSGTTWWSSHGDRESAVSSLCVMARLLPGPERA